MLASDCFKGAHTYLWSHKLGCAAKGTRRRAVPHLLLAQSVIAYFDVPIESEQDIVQLEIAVDDTILVKVLEGETDLCRVESGTSELQWIYWKRTDLLCALSAELASLNVQHQVATTNIFHYKVHPGFGLETGV